MRKGTQEDLIQVFRIAYKTHRSIKPFGYCFVISIMSPAANLQASLEFYLELNPKMKLAGCYVVVQLFYFIGHSSDSINHVRC